jgi:WD40 repeat protein
MISDDYYQVGGSLEYQHPAYVVRQADHDLYRELKNGNYCYVLNSRQMGKSSLRVQVMKTLKQEDLKCASVDITGIGSNVTPNEWYGGLISELLRGFGLTRKVDFKTWWRQQEVTSPIQRLKEFIEDVLLTEFSQNIVIFIDEIDSILRIPFKDDFFAFIRACYNYRADQSAYKRLTFCLLGVATPSNLIQNKDRTPFNIGQAIELHPFQLHEVQPLVQGLVGKVDDPQGTVKEILAWSGGQPFLTQKLCQLVVENANRGIVADDFSRKRSPSPRLPESDSPFLDQLIREALTEHGDLADQLEVLMRSQVIENWAAQDEPEHLRTIRDRLLRNQKQAGRLLTLYQQILNQSSQNGQSASLPKGIVADDSPEQMELRLTGLVVKRDGRLQIYNRIYAEVFNRTWVEHTLAELRPYAADLAAWVESGEQDETCLLRGQALLNAQLWAADKNLGTQDYRFLAASQQLAKQEVQTILEREQQATRVLASANHQAKQRIRIGSAILALCLVLAVIAGLLTRTALQDQRLAQAGARLEQAGVNALQQFESQQIEALLSAMQAGQELQHLVQHRPLAQYPATNPLFALQQILDQIREKNQLQGDQGRVLSVSFSPRSQRIVSTGQDGTVWLWGQTQRPIANLKGHEGWVKQARFSPDGQRLATVGFDGVRLWDQTGKPLAQLIGHGGGVMDVIFSPDSQWVITGGQDGTVRVWDLTGKLLQTLNGQQGEVHALAISPGGQRLIAGGVAGMRLWTRVGNQFTPTPLPSSLPVQTWVSGVGFSRNGQLLATAGLDGATLWDRKGDAIAQFKRHQGKVNSVRFSPTLATGDILASAGSDGTIRLWNQSGQQLTEFRGHQGKVNSISFSPDGQTLVSAGDDGSIRLWQPARRAIPTFDGHQHEIYSVRFSPDGRRLATAGQDRTVRLWTSTGEPLRTFKGFQGRVLSLSFSPDGQRLAMGGFEEQIRLWTVEGTLLHEFKGNSNGSFSVTFSPDSQLLAVGGEESAQIWTLEGTLLAELKPDQPTRIKEICFSPDGKMVATAGADGSLRLWNLDGTVVKQFEEQNTAVHTVSFSPDGRLIVTAGLDGIVRLWDRDGKLHHELKGHTGAIQTSSFSPDSQLVATAGSDGSVRLWSQTGALIAEYRTDTAIIYSISFSPDGRSLAIAGDDGRVRLWPVNSLDQLLERGCDWLHDYLIAHPNAPKLCSRESL